MEGTMEIHQEDCGHQEGDGAGEATQARGKSICIRYYQYRLSAMGFAPM